MAIKTTSFKSRLKGGQFEPDLGGQFAPDRGGQLRPDWGGHIERIFQISRHFNYKLIYLGQHNLENIKNSIKLGISVNYDSIPMIKLGEDIREEINKIKEQRPIVFGGKYNKKSSHKLELIPN